MRRLTLLCALSLSSCVANHDELDVQQAVLDAELAMAMARADSLNEARREVDNLDQRIELELREFPELAEEWKSMQALPGTVVAPRAPPALPPESVFEGSGGARKRTRIADTDARLRQLDRVLAELVRLDLHRVRGRRMLEAIEKARAASTK